jgi:hypothetical protein
MNERVGQHAAQACTPETSVDHDLLKLARRMVRPDTELGQWLELERAALW